MDTTDLVGLLIPTFYFVMLAVESRRAGNVRRGWRWLGVGFLVLIATMGAVVPLLLPLDWMAAHRWLDEGRVIGKIALAA